jgi:hypothetical protein
MAARLYPGSDKSGRELYHIDGVLIDDIVYLTPGSKCVLVCEGEDAFLDQPPAPVVSEVEEDVFARDPGGVRTVTTSFFM